ncbi:MAG: DUF1871 family protein [Mycobacterium leprae]
MRERYEATRQRLEEDAPEVLDAIRTAVNDVDPVHLMGFGAPDDEYDPEVTDLAEGLLSIGPDPEQLAAHAQEVFDRWFYPDCVSAETCREIAARLCRVWIRLNN